MINWYGQRFSFPHRGLKYFRRLLQATGNEHRYFVRRLPNGLLMKLTPAEHIQRQLFWYGWYEKKYMTTWYNMIHPDSVVMDIGANIGYYTLSAAQKAAKVYALEPASDHFLQLRENAILNQFNNIVFFQLAASDRHAQVPLYHSGSGNTGMTGLSRPESFSGQTEEVQTVRMDDLVEEQKISRVDLVKIDIEGAELHALKGMSRMLEKMSPVLFVEINDSLLSRFGHSVNELYAFLLSFGYLPYRVEDPKNLVPAKTGWEDELVVFIKDKQWPAVLKA